MRSNWLALALVAVVLLAGTVRQGWAQSAKSRAEMKKLLDRAEKLKTAGKLPEAAKAYQQALARARKRFGQSHLVTADAMAGLAEVRVAEGQYAQAEPLYRRSVAIREAKLG